MRKVVLPLLLGLLAPRVYAESDALFKLGGKTVSAKDLTPAQQQQLFDIKQDAYTHLEQFAEQTALDLYIDEQAKKDGKPRLEEEAKLLPVKEPSEKDVADWYEQNKARVPPGYTLDKISGEIKTGLREQSKKEKRDELIASLQKDGKLALLTAEPTAPLVKLDIKGFPEKGAGSAKVTLVEFADYQCPHCKAAVAVIDGLLKKYDGKLKLVFMDYPIKGEFSELAAQGAYCAGTQGKFWEFHDMAYDKQAALHAKDAAAGLAKELKLDEKGFSDCLDSKPAKDWVNKARAEGDRVGLTGTPSIFVNGRKVRGYEEGDLAKEIDRALKGGQS